MGTWEDGPGVVELPDGRRLRGRGLRGRASAGGMPAWAAGERPDLAVLLLGRRPPEQPWDTRWVAWRDFGRPASTAEALDAVREAHRRAAGERVEIACGGGVGRTGTALALAAVLAGVDPAEAVRWVRAVYHPRAAETPWQRRWVVEAARLL